MIGITLEIEFDKTFVEKTSTQSKSSPKQSFSYEEVKERTAEYFGGDALAAEVWINKYALKDFRGNIYERDPSDMHRRISGELSRIENEYPNPIGEEEIFQLLDHFRYLVPQGGPMAGIGNDKQVVSLSNCFVIGNPGKSDSYSGIMRIDEEQVQLMKRRGGVGHDLSHIRPRGSSVKNSAVTSTGIVTFMERYSNSTREVAQDGRRGALMLTLSSRHPDILDFIHAKKDNAKVTGANISVKIDDEFMEAVQNDQHYYLQFPVDDNNHLVSKKVKARVIWDAIVDSGWSSAEPGILFWDTIIRESVADCYAKDGFKSISTNPCGEIPLCPYDSCRLLAINLLSYVKNPFTPDAEFDFNLFEKHAIMAQRIMDDIIDLEIEKIDKIIKKIISDPEPFDLKRVELNLWKKIKNKCQEGRRMGIGITAEGDMVAAMGLKYGSQEAVNLSEKVHKFLALGVYRASVKLAGERGAFPLFDFSKEIKNPFIKRLAAEDPDLYKEMKKKGRRNISLLTIAPTGTTSLMTQTTSGIEPAFSISYKRRRKLSDKEQDKNADFVDELGDRWSETYVFHHGFKSWLLVNGYNPETVMHFDNDKLDAIIAKSPYSNSTAKDIDWIQKVKMQGAIQKWVDHSISVTVNVPKETTREQISEIYLKAWENGCKGVTIYREGSRSGVLVRKDDKKDLYDIKENHAPRRPKILRAKILRFLNNEEKWIAIVGMLNDKPYEIFTGKAEDSFAILSTVNEGWVIKNKLKDSQTRYDFQYADKAGYRITIEGLSRCFDPEYWNYAKLISGVLRHGMPLKFVVDLVDNLSLEGASLNTWKNGVSRALGKFIPDGTTPINQGCPECEQESLVYQEGCITCKNCGYSKCK